MQLLFEMVIRVLALMGLTYPFLRDSSPSSKMILGWCLLSSISLSLYPVALPFFLTLIPRVDSPSQLGDFIPIFLVVSHFQYEEDTIILANDTIDNIWTIKTILRGFELTSGLCVKFSKSSLTGENYDQAFINLSCEFLHCK